MRESRRSVQGLEGEDEKVDMSVATLQAPVKRLDGQKGSEKGAFCSNILGRLRRQL